MDFLRLFTHLNYAPGGQGIEINENGAISLIEHPTCTSDRTRKILKDALIYWEETCGLSVNWNQYLDAKVITTDVMRNLYRSVIREKLAPFERHASEGSQEEYLLACSHAIVRHRHPLYRFTAKGRDVNQKTCSLYRESLVKKWGEKRVQRAFLACEFDEALMSQGVLPLKCCHVCALSIALADLHTDDVQETYEALFTFCRKGRFDCLPDRIAAKLQEHFASSVAGHIAYLLLEKLSPFPRSFLDLKKETVDFLMRIIDLSTHERELVLLGNRVEGVISGQRPFLSKSKYIYDKCQEDKERFQVYQEMKEIYNQPQTEQMLLRYLEYWTKCLIKKEISTRYPITCGTIVPGMDQGWYMVGHELRQTGKVTLHLHPMGAHDDTLPTLMIHRSTASSPSATQAIYTVIQDLNPFDAPGYLDPLAGFEEGYACFLKGSKPLIMSGHSLGGSFCQIDLVNYLRRLQKEKRSFPHRFVRLVLFDTPGIAKKDCDYFCNWVAQHPEEARRIRIDYYFSKKDILPGAGARHLGYGAHDEAICIAFRMMKVHYRCKEPELKLHPHCRFYFRTQMTEEKSYGKVKGIAALERYDNQQWRRTFEARRCLLGLFLFPLLLLIATIKHHLFGARGRPGLVHRLINRLEEKLLLASRARELAVKILR